MDRAIYYHFNKSIKERVKLTGGYTFQTWLLTLSDDEKIVFRARKDFETSGGRKIIISDVLEREKYFYDTINSKVGNICPKVYVIDSSCEYYDMPYCIMEYIEGTPLNLCFNDFDPKTKNDVLYKIGEITARINSIEIDENHPYITNRKPWEDYMADRLHERLSPFVKNGIITSDEIKVITDGMRCSKAKRDKAFLHLDMRHVNMIYNKDGIFILDAENCEFGDPLFDLATIDVGGELEPVVIEGYKSICREIDLDDKLYYYYKMERQALVLDVFMNEVKTDTKLTQYYLDKFNEVKNKLSKS